MRIEAMLVIAALGVAVTGCTGTPQRPKNVEPPAAKVVPHELERHGDVRVDDYYWLNQRGDPEVIEYLEAENVYTEAMMAHTEGLQETLFEEIKGRIKQTDMSVPYRYRDYWYYTRMEDGKGYPIYCRKKGSMDGEEEVLLDVNALAEGHEFTSVGKRAISSGQQIMAYPVDHVGRRIYTIRFKNLQTGEQLEDTITDVTSNIAWAEDDRTLFYTRQDPVTLRSYRIYRHVLGTPQSADELVFQEDDDTFSCYVFKTRSRDYILIASYQTLSTEYRYLEANKPDGELRVIEPRRRDHEYSVDHIGDEFYIKTNHDAKNFRLMKTPVTATGQENWVEVIPHRDDVLLEDFDLFRDFMVLEERRNGLNELRILPWSGEGEHYIDFGEPAYSAYVYTNPEQDTHVLRYAYESMTTPDSIFDYDTRTREKDLLKQEEVLGGFDSANYETDRLYATAQDGTKIPISIVYRKGLEKNGANPLVLYGYGSYGTSLDASFRSDRLSLIDRGFVYAIAHVRGGEEMGRSWYEDGKLLKKKNTFTDFIDVAEHLVEERYTEPGRLYATGGSAGGLLMGAIINMRPDLFHGVVTAVPFVDVVTTMLDDSIPLTTSEFDEWGDPKDPEYYEYIKSYSPYDNVVAQSYPHLLVTTGLHDSQVQYFEPAKWVAKLRATRNGESVLLLKTEMGAGHGGVSGRYKKYRELAFRYAFLLDLAESTGS
jgi:oligopeptidase B